ncbi:DUF4131 domain-containing protein [Hankyongella ginsenosidimutans]|nr:DUF4131 domain-containing protein [Hankyongella ginsenosidimutans]
MRWSASVRVRRCGFRCSSGQERSPTSPCPGACNGWRRCCCASARRLAPSLFAGRLAWAVRGALLVALGLGSAWMRAESVNTPTLRQQIVNATVEGRVRSFEPRAQGGSRFVLGDVRIRAGTGLLHLRLVRITARGEGIALRPGQAVRVRAWLQPPRLPLTPDGYDAARRAWFEGVGATGIAMGPIAVLQPPLARTSLWQLLEELRQRLGVRIRDRIPGAPAPSRRRWSPASGHRFPPGSKLPCETAV